MVACVGDLGACFALVVWNHQKKSPRSTIVKTEVHIQGILYR